ncbi:MAG: DNA topoisomerase 3 [Bryobacterales bacterium]|nr:DNA topoisomerase 3 [Bryobacterales bacterium]
MARRTGGKCAIVAEKPSVARDIANALGARTRGKGYFSSAEFVVTWAVGHLVRLAEPHEIDPSWRFWRRDSLPMLPGDWPLRVDEERADQFGIVKGILNSRKVGRVVCATDAGREGELIFRQIYDLSGSSKPVDRLWISSLTPAAIREGFRRLRPSSEFDGLADAARGRERADWLVGLNLTRLYTLDGQPSEESRVLSVGRVQTPTLAMLVEREKAIRDFVPEDYLEVHADFESGDGQRYSGVYFRLERGKRQKRLPADGEAARQILDRAKSGRADVQSVHKGRRRKPPPLLYDLTELQRHANRLYGFSAERTLSLAQALYEKHKAITYPRTDSRHLSSEMARQLPRITPTVSERYDPSLIAEGTGRRQLGRRFVNDEKVSDHHAIIPTGAGMPVPAGSPEAKLLDLICRRFLQAWHGDYRYSTTTVITRVVQRSQADQYLSTGVTVEDAGWKVLDVKRKAKRGAKPKPKLPAGLRRGDAVRVLDARAVKKKTKPPPRYTDASLLTAMESAGEALDDKALSDAMKERGIGTPATRAGIIETLLKRGYVERSKKVFLATPLGIRLIDTVHPKVRSPALTGEWEAKLRGIERGSGGLDPFMRGIEEFVREVVGGDVPKRAPLAVPPARATVVADGDDVALAPAAGGRRKSPVPSSRIQAETAGPIRSPRPAPKAAPPAGNGQPQETRFGTGAQGTIRPGPIPAQHSTPPSADARPAPARISKAVMQTLLQDRFGHRSFRPNQEATCRDVIEGRDVLLVMPTGAGKSLCYQLPGIARGATTIVISPLIALMEDQAAKLREQGFRAERIHSGRDRMESRRVCIDYKRGNLDFLFIAPERFSVPGFPELLASYKPGLVAIDEAHCISMWGHDFRPDYRRLRERVPMLRPAPVIALTATATSVVQRDIIEQLGLDDCKRAIHGFRRENLEIEHVDLVPSVRPQALSRLLLAKDRRPAIVYAPTRSAAESQAELLRGAMPAAAYHAGMAPADREKVQSAFLAGDLEVIVATIAFGMGIDKPDVRTVAHTALPASVEGYYQEIGRAGRDGKPSKAVLMHSWADRKTHEFFLDRDYPEPEALDAMYGSLTDKPTAVSALMERFPGDEYRSEKAVEKLWTHGGLTIGPSGEEAFRGDPGWRDSYVEQRDYKLRQIDLMTDLTRSRDCRMLDLVRHFDDIEDSLKPCGHCDNCDSSVCLVAQFRQPSPDELRALSTILQALRERDAQSSGRLFRELIEPGGMKRKAYERLVSGLARARLIDVAQDEFQAPDGRLVTFSRLYLTPSGRYEEDAARQVRVKTENAGLKKPPKGRPRGPAAVRKSGGRPKQVELGGSAGGHDADLIAAALRAWRKDEARRTGTPAFRILLNATLEELAQERPTSRAELVTVKGIGPFIAKKYGPDILRVIRSCGD